MKRHGVAPTTARQLLSVLLVTCALVLVTSSYALGAGIPSNVYRFFNRSNGSHFFTSSEYEKEMTRSRLSATYTYEGIGWRLNEGSGSQPLWRFYNRRTGSHFYTANDREKDYIVAALASTYSFEGEAYKVSLSEGVPVYRFYVPSRGYHFYTASVSERDNIIGTLSWYYSYEGQVFRVPQPAAGSYYYLAACGYADWWCMARNPAYRTDFRADCTNFVSQCLHDTEGGSKAFDYSGASEAYKWYMMKDSWGLWSYTSPWVNASWLYNYMMENPAGTFVRSWDWNDATTESVPPPFPGETRQGDVVFYDWDGSGSKDHVGIRVGSGVDPDSGLSGDYTDQHVSDRYHSIWHLQPYNANWRTTRITLVRPM